MKKQLIWTAAVLALLTGGGTAQATLTTIGSATYMGSDYNLIWDDNNNGNSVIWLDYSNAKDIWVNQTSWAASLDTQLTYNIDAVYTVSWDGDWRLGSTMKGESYGYDGTTARGYNITSSEMGHLFYEELSNLGYYDTSGTIQADYGLHNTGDFDNLIAFDGANILFYWSGTGYQGVDAIEGAWEGAWYFTSEGYQDTLPNWYTGYGLALRTGQVSQVAAVDPVPEPTTMLLFGTGIAGLAAVGRRKK